MTFGRGIDGSDPLRPQSVGGRDGWQEERRSADPRRLGSGTLACPRCDAPVALVAAVLPAEPLGCPFCGHAARVRDFLSLTAPTRPARVAVRVVYPS
jgi:hypothetical protein